MSTWLRYFSFWRRDPHTDASDEIRFHLEMRTRDLMTRGMSAADARATAEREFGNARTVQRQLEQIDSRILRREERAGWWRDLGRDVRFGVRTLRNSPAFTVTSVLTAALGIGVTSAIVSVAYAVLVRPLPYPDADGLVAIYGENTVRGFKGSNISWPDFMSWRERNRAFSAIGIWTWNTKTVSDDGSEAERVSGAEVSANLFPLLGIHPILGRDFRPEEEEEGNSHVVLLSHRFWQQRHAGDPAIVGKSIMLDGRPWTVVGVMPPGFNFPDRGDIWVPFSTNPQQEYRDNRGYAGAIGRLKPGVTFEQGRDDLHRVDAELAREFPKENSEWRADVLSLRDDLVGNLRLPLRIFLGAVALVLLMVCANVANLTLARGTMRSREVAIRTALGGSRRRLARQLLTESLLVATLGGIGGVAIAWVGVRLLRFAFPGDSPPFYVQLGLDGASLAFVAAITIVAGVLFGTLPALRGSRVDLNASLRDGARAGSGAQRSRLRAALVIGEVALSVVLMVGASLLMRSYRNLAQTPLGFDEQGILSARYVLPRNAGYPTRASLEDFTERLFARLRSVPGVTMVGAAQGIPFSGWDVQSSAAVEGSPPARPGDDLIVHYQIVTPDFFKAMGVPLVRGRWLTAADRDTQNLVVLVNEEMVAKGFGGREPLGQRIQIGGSKEPYATVVGVVGNYRHYRLPQPMGPAVYYAFATYPIRQQTIVLRTTSGDPRALVPVLRTAIREMDARVALYQVQTFEEVVSRSLWRQRLQGNVLAIFAIMSLVLACIGIYGLIAYAVSERTRELGVRMALGATARSVLVMVLTQSGRLVAAGVAVGVVAAYFATRLLSSLLYGVAANDPVTFAAVPLVLGAVALIAAIVPARRAARVDPIIAMRAE